MRSPYCLCVCVCLYVYFPCNFLMLELIFTELCMCFVYLGTWAHLNGALNKPFPPLSVPCMYAPHSSLLGTGSVNTFLRQRMHSTILELLDTSFSTRSVSYQMRVCVSARSCDRPNRSSLSVVFLGPRANAELVPKFQVALYASHAALQMVTLKNYDLM
jgi:hypothetical protein